MSLRIINISSLIIPIFGHFHIENDQNAVRLNDTAGCGVNSGVSSMAAGHGVIMDAEPSGLKPG
jgi:hypothetical protein